jgi:hypothetical protein
MKTVISFLLAVLLGIFLFVPAAAVQASPPGGEHAVKLVANDGAIGDAFGSSVAVAGALAVVGAPQADVDGHPDQGAVYVFGRRGHHWRQLARLVAPDSGNGAHFGTAVALSHGRIVVGAPDAVVDGDSARGAVYVFTRKRGHWSRSARLIASDGMASHRFGFSLAAFGHRLLIGAPFANAGDRTFTQEGAAYVFKRHRHGWYQTAKLGVPAGDYNDRFGTAVALSRDKALVGAIGVVNSAGRGYVFSRSGKSWTLSDVLSAGATSRNSLAGWAVALDRTTGLLSELREDSQSVMAAGVVFVYDARGAHLTGVQSIAASDPTSEAEFGASLSLSRKLLAVGAPAAGHAYLFARRHHNGWQQVAEFPATGASYGFGSAVSVSRHWLAVGNNHDVVDGMTDRGAVYLYFLRGIH